MTTENTEEQERQRKIVSYSVTFRVFRGHIPEIISFPVGKILLRNAPLFAEARTSVRAKSGRELDVSPLLTRGLPQQNPPAHAGGSDMLRKLNPMSFQSTFPEVFKSSSVSSPHVSKGTLGTFHERFCTSLDTKIDELVNQLYDITSAERKIIEGR